MLDNERCITIVNLGGKTTLRVCEGTDPDDGEVYYFLERDITVHDLSNLVNKRGDRIPAHVIGGLTGRARLWLDKPAWSLEYMDDDDDIEPCYYSSL